MKLNVEHISPDDEAYLGLESLRKRERKPNNTGAYNQAAASYNDTEVGGYVSLGLVPFTTANFEKAMGYRGLDRDTDYNLFKINRTDTGKRIPAKSQPLVMKRLTSRQANTLN